MNPFYEKKEKKLEFYNNPHLSFPEHLHEHIEILFVKEGSVEVTVSEKCNDLTVGDCAVIFPGQIHSYHCLEKGAFLLLLFDPSLSESYTHIIRKALPESAFIQKDAISSDVSLAFERLLLLFYKQTSVSPLQKDHSLALASAWIHVILANLMPLLQLKERKQSENTELTQRLVIYIMEHFREPLSLDLLAEQLHVSKYYLSHVFSAYFKMGFRQYLNQIRLNYALQAMQSTELTITQIWGEAGFNSQRSFNRFFLEMMEMTPMEYRKMMK